MRSLWGNEHLPSRRSDWKLIYPSASPSYFKALKEPISGMETSKAHLRKTNHKAAALNITSAYFGLEWERLKFWISNPSHSSQPNLFNLFNGTHPLATCPFHIFWLGISITSQVETTQISTFEVPQPVAKPAAPAPMMATRGCAPTCPGLDCEQDKHGSGAARSCRLLQ